MIKKTKNGRVSNSSGWGRDTCEDCGEPAKGREVVTIFRPRLDHTEHDHAELYLTECFLKMDPRYRDRYEIALAAVAALDAQDAAEGTGCNICGFQPRRRDVIVCHVLGKAGRRFFMHFACFMGEDILRPVPNTHISIANARTPILALPAMKSR